MRLPLLPNLAVLLTAATGAVAGPINPLYFINLQTNQLTAVQGSSIVLVAAAQGPQSEAALAVDSTVRTYGGFGYNLNGSSIGTVYPPSISNPRLQFLDGASDGTSNYAIGWDDSDRNNDQVYRFNSDWTSPTVLFTASYDSWGITWDSASGTIWTASRGDNRLHQYTVGGTELTSFSTLFTPAALAYDPGDGTLWTNRLVDVFSSVSVATTFDHYSTSGTYLGSQSYAALAGAGIFGAEFAAASNSSVTPEPSTVTLFLAGIALSGVGPFLRRARLRNNR